MTVDEMVAPIEQRKQMTEEFFHVVESSTKPLWSDNFVCEMQTESDNFDFLSPYCFTHDECILQQSYQRCSYRYSIFSDTVCNTILP